MEKRSRSLLSGLSFHQIMYGSLKSKSIQNYEFSFKFLIRIFVITIFCSSITQQLYSQCGTVSTNVVISTNTTCTSISVTGSLTVAPGVTLTVGSITVSGTLIVNGTLNVTNNTNALTVSGGTLSMGSSGLMIVGPSGNSATNTVMSVSNTSNINSFAAGSSLIVNGALQFDNGNSATRVMNGEVLVLGNLNFGNNNGSISGTGTMQATGTVTQPNGQPVNVYGSTTVANNYPINSSSCLTVGTPSASNGTVSCGTGTIVSIGTPSGTGTGALSYQWQSSSSTSPWSNISGANSISYTTPNLNTKTNFRIKVTRAAGGTGCASSITVTSSVVSVSVSGTVTPTVSLSSSSICASSTVVFTANTANTGSGTISYSFLKNGTSVQVGASNTYSASNLVNGNQVYCNIVITNGACLSTNTVNSNTITTTVNAVPTISIQPSTTTRTYCQNATSTALSVTAAAGSGTISTYRWYSNTTALNTGGILVATNTSSATTNSYSPLTTTAGTLYYYSVVTNSNGCSITSNVSGSTVVNAIPTAVAGGSQSICQTSTATVSGASSTNGTILWTENGAGTITSGSTTLTPTYTPAISDTGKTVTLTLSVSNSPCAVATATYSVFVYTPPTIITHPSSSNNTYCQNATVSVLQVVTRGDGLTYQWYRNTTSSNVGGTLVSGAISSSYSPSVSVIGTSYYYFVIGGTCAPIVTSNVSGAITIVENSSTFTSNATGLGTFTVPAGVTRIKIRAWGAGGGASKGFDLGAGPLKGTGGGGGGFSEKTLTVTPGQIITYNIGVGGVGATTLGSNGSAGGNTTITDGSISITANGGGGGVSTNLPSGIGGAGGIGTGGDLNFTGGSGRTLSSPNSSTTGGGGGGSAGIISDGNSSLDGAGGVAVSGGGAGGNGGGTNSNGAVGSIPGGGGGGNAGSGFGANGAVGQIEIIINPTTIVYSSNSFCRTIVSSPVTISGISGGTFTSTTGLSINSGTGQINPSLSTAGTYTVFYGNFCTPSIATTTVTISATPTAVAGGSQTICQSSTATISGASSTNGSISWTENGAGTITAGSTTLTPTYTSAAGDAGNTVLMTMTVSNSPCTAATATYSVAVKATPTAVSGGSQTICQSSTATVSGASSTNGTILWTENGAGTITAGSTTLTPTYTPAAGDAGNTVLMTMTVSNSPCTAATATYSVAVSPSLSNNSIGSDETVCSNANISPIASAATLSGGNGSYAYTWETSTTSALAGFATASGQTASSFTSIPLTTTTWFRRVVASGGCSSTSNVVQKSINGTSFTWTGNVNSSWNVAGNWCNNTVPSTNDDPTIPVVATNYPVIDNITAYSNDITVATGSRITIQNNGTLDISGNWANNGILYPNDGTKVRFSAATGTQTITGSATQYFYNLEKSSGSTLVIGTGVNVQINRGGLVSVNAGTLDLNNRTLLLKSKISATGIDSTASLGVVVGSIANASNFTQERYNSAVRGVRYISSPVIGMTFARLKDSIVIAGPTAAGFDAPNTTASTAKEYQEPRNFNWTKCWVSLTSINTALASGTGYYLYVPSKRTTVFPAAEPVTLLMKGTPFTGGKTFSLSYTATGSTGWNLVGNPYPSAIDWDSPSWTKTNLDGAIYIWDPAMGSSGGYYTYVSGIASDGRNNGSVIGSSQGFFVKASGANPALSVTENAKVGVKAKTNFRVATPSYVTLKVSSQNGDVDYATVRLSTGMGNEDAVKFSNPKLNLYSKKSAQSLAINAVDETKEALNVPLYLESATATSFKVEVVKVSGEINANSDLKMKDESTGEVVPVTEGTVLNLAKDANTQRLTLFRVAESQVVTTATDNKLSEMQLYPNHLVEGSYPTLVTGTTTDKRITIYNASGGVVSSQGTSAREYTLSDFKHLASGVYQVRVASAEGTRVFKVVK